MNLELSFHLVVVVRHEDSHFIHNLVFTLGLDSILILLQFSGEKIRLSILEQDGLLLGLSIAYEAGDLGC